MFIECKSPAEAESHDEYLRVVLKWFSHGCQAGVHTELFFLCVCAWATFLCVLLALPKANRNTYQISSLTEIVA